jgi:hypothetical protein
MSNTFLHVLQSQFSDAHAQAMVSALALAPPDLHPHDDAKDDELSSSAPVQGVERVAGKMGVWQPAGPLHAYFGVVVAAANLVSVFRRLCVLAPVQPTIVIFDHCSRDEAVDRSRAANHSQSSFSRKWKRLGAG